MLVIVARQRRTFIADNNTGRWITEMLLRQYGERRQFNMAKNVINIGLRAMLSRRASAWRWRRLTIRMSYAERKKS